MTAQDWFQNHVACCCNKLLYHTPCGTLSFSRLAVNMPDWCQEHVSVYTVYFYSVTCQLQLVLSAASGLLENRLA